MHSELAILLSAPRGRRNDQLNRSAFALGQMAGGGVLDCAEVAATLVRAAESLGLVAEDGLRACERTIDSGMSGGMARPRGRVTA